MTAVGTATPTPVSVTHHGIEYPGELIRTPTWQPSLTYPLATLFLLLWLRDGHHAARLRTGHGLLLRNGQRFASDTLTSADIPALRWPMDLWERIKSFSPVGPSLLRNEARA